MAVDTSARARLRRQLVVIAAFALIPLGSQAGPLSRTSKSIGKRAGSSPSRGGGTSSTSSRGDRSQRPTRLDDCCYRGGTTYGVTPLWAAPPRYRLKLAPKMELFLGAQSVKGSDHAGDVRVRIHQGPIGFGFTGTRYVESFAGPTAVAAGNTSVMQGAGVSMDLWSFTLDTRVLRDGSDRTTVWLRGGITGASSTDFEQIFGPTLGVMMTHKLSRTLGLRGSARQYWFEYDVSAREYRAEITASVLSVGYRVLKFNVGDPLHGPTAGLQLAF